MTNLRSRREGDGVTPRWVKISATGAAIVVLTVAGMLLAGHGPGRHLPTGATPPAQTATDHAASASGNP